MGNGLATRDWMDGGGYHPTGRPGRYPNDAHTDKYNAPRSPAHELTPSHAKSHPPAHSALNAQHSTSTEQFLKDRGRIPQIPQKGRHRTNTTSMSLDANRELPASGHYGGSLDDSRKKVSFSLSFPSTLAPKRKEPRSSLKLLASPHLHRFARMRHLSIQLSGPPSCSLAPQCAARCTQLQSHTRGHQVRDHPHHIVNWPYLTDVASYKPTHLPIDDPAAYSFFSNTSGRRICYVAPERFDKRGGSRCSEEAEKTTMSIWLFQIDAYRCSPPIPPCSRSS
ncbi:hypothetical protein FIBSPDRAFT_202548 [Athelia psychrophila]|uniref:Uncharacterized protein n=1 Tax=Athelia psychrophila TaxID=1759441 RepID=A0A165ZH88_9AGAM|nr:hypothetical protein FIBSPDRAFT_202548 [Fibularhizoctonia sp. CBS 109695]